MNDYLTGQNANLSTVLDTFVDRRRARRSRATTLLTLTRGRSGRR